MYIERKYKSCDWFTLLDLMREKLSKPEERTDKDFIEFADELRMRLLESISEGATFKIGKAADELKSYAIQAELNPTTQKELDSIISSL